jgi:uncharacterized protein (DUF983 family)
MARKSGDVAQSTWRRLATAIWRAFWLRCPLCGHGPLFVGRLGHTMRHDCATCGLVYDRGDGYFTGALGLNLVLTETVATALWVPLAVSPSVPMQTIYAVAIAASVGLPIAAFRHTRSLWIAIDRFINPAS